MTVLEAWVGEAKEASLLFLSMAESVYRDSHLPDRYHADPAEHMRNIITIARMIADNYYAR